MIRVTGFPWIASLAAVTFLLLISGSSLAVTSYGAKPLATNVACPPDIYFTYVPSYGSNDNLQGQVTCVAPADYKVIVYIYVVGWWTKPTFASPLTPIQSDGTWTTDITTGGADPTATKIAAFLVPDGYSPPLMSGGAPLPEELFENAVAYTHVERTRRMLVFAGRTWHVKHADYLEGPGPNCFSDAVEDVWVDADGRLHLKVVQRNSKWHSTEVFTEDPLGYGRYIFRLASPVNQLNENVVLGLFTWDSVAPLEFQSREIDIEFSRWGNQANPNNAQYVVQPYNQVGNLYGFHIALAGEDSAHSFDWRTESIQFASFQGHNTDSGNEIESWLYTGPYIPLADDGNARINLWLVNGIPPSDGQEVEVIIEDFVFLVAEPQRVFLPVILCSLNDN